MKTLDEVIETLVRCTDYDAECAGCPYKDENEGGLECEMRNLTDVLHYLKEYQKQMTDPDGDHQQLEKARKLLQDFYRNEPLSWDELRQMEGKPVWIENNYGFRGWEIVDKVWQEKMETREDEYPKEEIGKHWQAYRKERS